jgi:hypothetical protein
MPTRRTVLRSLPVALLMISTLACGVALTGNPTADLGEIVRQTLAAMPTQAAPVVHATVEAPQVSAPPPQATQTPEPSPTVAVVHQVRPGNPAAVASWLTDPSSAAFAAQRRAIADNFAVSLLERPFTSNVMDYQPYLDITRGELSAFSPWVYITIFLEGAPPADAKASYAVELDLDLDGRGDWLITAVAPTSTDWTTDAVRAYRDADHDVGGAHPMRADPPPQAGDGYETLVFDQGQGADPDAAWARLSPGNPARVQIAFKFSLIRDPDKFLWGVWADEGLQHPEWFDYVDHFTPADAGSPVGGASIYPLKAMASLDNSCRWVYDFTPTGTEPGLCSIPATPTPVPTPRPTRTPTKTPYIIY